MALGDLMAASRYPQSLVAVTNHLDECSSNQEDEDFHGRRDSETASGSSGGIGFNTATSMAYLPHTSVFCELRNDAFEAHVPMGPSDNRLVSNWRPKDRMKTGCVALVLCLNISVDPQDVIKISPCARMECWTDPFSIPPPKALDAIGNNLSRQYERLQPRARYKVQLDPTVEKVKKLCTSCRKYTKTERVLFHYNGHGVPKPTANGEIWLFNKSYTQYIPLPVSDLDSWLKAPSIYCV